MNGSTIRRILKNSIAIYGKNGFDTIIGLICVAILARYLSLSDFGKYSFILAFVTVFKVISTMGINTILIREIAKNKDGAEKLYPSALIIQLFLSIITFSIIAIGINLTRSPHVVIKATYLYALAVIFEFAGKTFSSIFHAFEHMEFDAYKTIFSQTVYLMGIISVTVLDLGLMGVFYALVLASFLDAGFGYYMATRRFVKLKISANYREIKYLIKETIPLGIKMIFRKINFRIDTLILAAIKSDAEVGLFHGVYKIVQNLMFVAEGSMQAIFPVFSRYYSQSEKSFHLAYEKSVKFLMVIGIPFALLLTSFAQELIHIILGQKFYEAIPALQILGWVVALMFMSNLMERILIIGCRQSICTWITAIALSINIILDFLMIPHWSFIGASVATLISEIILLLLGFYFVHKLIVKKSVFLEIVKPVFAGVITYIILYLLRDMNFILAGILGFMSYAAILVLTKTFTKEDRLILGAALGKI